MSSTFETKNMYAVLDEPEPLKEGTTYTGTLGFDEEKRRGYIEMDDGRRVPTTPLFEFFNGFISLYELVDRMPDNYTDDDIRWFHNQWNSYQSGELSSSELVQVCKEHLIY